MNVLLANDRLAEISAKLLEHIASCLGSLPRDTKPNETPIDWSPFRVLENRVSDLLNSEEAGLLFDPASGEMAEKAKEHCEDAMTALTVASLLSICIHRSFNDLFTDTPWDHIDTIASERKTFHLMLRDFLSALEQTLEGEAPDHAELWRILSSFECRYNAMLLRINAKDLKIIGLAIPRKA